MLLVSLSCHDIDDRRKQENNNIKNKSFIRKTKRLNAQHTFCRFLCLHCATCIVKVDRHDNVIVTLISKIVNCLINSNRYKFYFFGESQKAYKHQLTELTRWISPSLCCSIKHKDPAWFQENNKVWCRKYHRLHKCFRLLRKKRLQTCFVNGWRYQTGF